VLGDLADMYDELAGAPGIPWAGLTADGHGIEENGYDPTYMDYMLKDGAEFFGVVGSLGPDFVAKYRTLREDEGRASVTRIMAIIDQMGTDVWQAVKDGDWDAFVALPRTTTVDAFAALAAAAANGAFLHYDGIMEAAMRAKKLKPAEVVSHANNVTKVFQTFVDLDKNGHFADLKKKPPPVAGLGLAPALIAAIVAIGVVLLLGLCYLIYVIKLAAPAQQKALEWCDKVAKEGSKEDAMACANLAASMEQKGNPLLGNIFAQALTPIFVVLAIGAAFWIAPTVIQGIRKTRAA
jgi:hypothetical protein